MINTLLITGCTHGLGRALALRFAHLGCFVYAVGRNESLLRELATISALLHPVVADIATAAGRKEISNQVDMQKPLSIIHNAAIAKPAQFASLTGALLREHFETNYFAPILITHHFLSSLINQQRILHISSGAANMALPGLMPYCATKAALEHTTQCLNAELNQRGVYCANLSPGMIDTPMQTSLRNSSQDVLPDREFYVRAKIENKLIAPEVAAKFVSWVMLKTENEAFSQTRWNIYDVPREQWNI